MKHLDNKEIRFPVFQSRFRELQGTRSNTEFADFLGMSRQTVGFYCNGNRIPDALGIAEIAKKCRVSADWLLGLSEEKTIDVDVRRVCELTGLSEEIVEYFIGKNRIEYRDGMFDPIQEFEYLFSPETLESLLCSFYSYSLSIQSLSNLEGMIKYTVGEDGQWTDTERAKDLLEMFLETERNIRYTRFETIDSFTALLDYVTNFRRAEERMDSLDNLFNEVSQDC